VTETALQVAVVVAHPDDETLWCGGLILQNADWHRRIVTLCRGSEFDLVITHEPGGNGPPIVRSDADRREMLPPQVWREKRRVLTRRSTPFFDEIRARGESA